jgi:S-adenosylmethionine synthetase
VLLHGQSADIAQGVDNAAGNKDEGAGDQGIMFGYACRETPDLMPAPIYYATRSWNCSPRRAARRAKGDAGKLGPDAKSQVTVRYENGKPVEVTQIVLSTQHLDEKLGFRRRSARSSSPISAKRCRPAGSPRKDRAGTSTRPASS